jgi:hypothetical protein
MNYDGDGESYFSPNSERPGKEGRRNVWSDFTSKSGIWLSGRMRCNLTEHNGTADRNPVGSRVMWWYGLV